MAGTVKKMAAKAHSTYSDPEEIAKFSALASRWWDAAGPMAPLHKLNPVRLDYLARMIETHMGEKKGLTLLDIGCGAGLVAERMAQKGYAVTGIDASQELIEAARTHARLSNTHVAYEVAEASSLRFAKKQFDIVLALEVIEHTEAPTEFVATVAQLVKPGGLVFFSTLNRSPKGFLLGIIGVEHILRWLPPGTHDWKRFVKPSELAQWMENVRLTIKDVSGLCYDPLRSAFYVNPRDVDVNYIVAGTRPA